MIRALHSHPRRARRLGVAVLGALAGTLALAANAAAASAASSTVTSSNWSGYAAHGSSTRFSDVSGRWRIPAATCATGEQSFSSFWVGIGGYDADSTGLEQDGTELDCNANGTDTVSAWYELLPAAPHTVSLPVHSGDLISASVHISGEDVTMTITDLTTHRTFTKMVRDHDIDDTSAEWIAEAPSECTTDTDCEVLPLADFGSVRFSNASARTTAGALSGIATRKWTTTRLLLGYRELGSDDFVAESDGSDATPSALSDAGRQFTVTWSGTTSSTSTGTGSGGTGSGSGGSGGTGTGGPGGGPNPGGGGQGGPGAGGNGNFRSRA